MSAEAANPGESPPKTRQLSGAALAAWTRAQSKAASAGQANPGKNPPKTRKLSGAALASSLGIPVGAMKTRPAGGMPARQATQSEVVEQIRKRVEARLKKDAKASLGDYIRLVQLEKELKVTDIDRLEIGWVEERTTRGQRSEMEGQGEERGQQTEDSSSTSERAAESEGETESGSESEK